MKPFYITVSSCSFYMHVFGVCEYAYTHTHVGQRLTFTVFFNCPLLYFNGAGLLLSRSPLGQLFSLGILSRDHPLPVSFLHPATLIRLLCECWASELWSSCWYSKHFIHRNVWPCLILRKQKGILTI